MKDKLLISPVKFQQKLKTKKFKDENENKTVRLEIRLTKKEMNDIKREAGDSGLSISQFVRNRVNRKAEVDPKIAINLVHMNELFNQAEEIMYDPNSEAGKLLRELNGEYNLLKDRLYESCIPKIERNKLNKRKDKIEAKEQKTLPEVV